VERASNKTSSRVDDELKHETEGLVRSGHDTHAQEWKSAEPSGEDQPEVTLEAETRTDVDARAELASYLNPSAYPATGWELVDAAIENQAPDRIVGQLKSLPAGEVFENLQAVWERLGGDPIEQQRF
jgi:hypothetical protein